MVFLSTVQSGAGRAQLPKESGWGGNHDENHGPKAGPSVLPCTQSSVSDMQVLDIKPRPSRQPDLSEKDDYTVSYAKKRENANSLLLIYPTTDI